mgnify:CR=1 FL=1
MVIKNWIGSLRRQARLSPAESGQSLIVLVFAFLGLIAMLGLALDLGLVDQLGGLDKAIQHAADKASIAA